MINQIIKETRLEYVVTGIALTFINLMLAGYTGAQGVNKSRVVFTMPRVMGMKYDDAVREIRKVYTRKIQKDGQTKDGTDVVVEQDPPVGMPLSRIRLVTLTVSVNPQVSPIPTATPTATTSPTASPTAAPMSPTPRETAAPTNNAALNGNAKGNLNDNNNTHIIVNAGGDWWLIGIIGGGLLFGCGASATVLRRARVRKWRRLMDVRSSLSSKWEVSIGRVSLDAPAFAVDVGLRMGKVEFGPPVGKRVEEHG